MKDRRLYSDDVRKLVSEFEELQGARVFTYNKLEEGYREYLNSGPDYDFLTYRSVISDITQEFKRISSEIIEIGNNIKNSQAVDIADLIESLQECERKKLEYTVEYQLARQMVKDSNDGELEVDKAKEIRLKIGSIIEEINEKLEELRYMIQED